TITLTGSSGDVSYRVAAIIQHSLPSPGGEETAVLSQKNGAKDFGVSGFNILQVVSSKPESADFQANLDNASHRYGMQLESVGDIKIGVRHGLDQLLLLLGSVGLVGVILGLMSVATTILLNTSESSRELALLRA